MNKLTTLTSDDKDKIINILEYSNGGNNISNDSDYIPLFVENIINTEILNKLLPVGMFDATNVPIYGTINIPNIGTTDENYDVNKKYTGIYTLWNLLALNINHADWTPEMKQLIPQPWTGMISNIRDPTSQIYYMNDLLTKANKCNTCQASFESIIGVLLQYFQKLDNIHINKMICDIKQYKLFDSFFNYSFGPITVRELANKTNNKQMIKLIKLIELIENKQCNPINNVNKTVEFMVPEVIVPDEVMVPEVIVPEVITDSSADAAAIIERRRKKLKKVLIKPDIPSIPLSIPPSIPLSNPRSIPPSNPRSISQSRIIINSKSKNPLLYKKNDSFFNLWGGKISRQKRIKTRKIKRKGTKTRIKRKGTKRTKQKRRTQTKRK